MKPEQIARIQALLIADRLADELDNYSSREEAEEDFAKVLGADGAAEIVRRLETFREVTR